MSLRNKEKLNPRHSVAFYLSFTVQKLNFIFVLYVLQHPRTVLNSPTVCKDKPKMPYSIAFTIEVYGGFSERLKYRETEREREKELYFSNF